VFFLAESNHFDFPNNRSILDMCLSKPIGLLALLDEESRFPQSTEFTLLNKWRENLNTPHFTASTFSSSLSRKSLKRQKQLSLDLQPLFTIRHYAGNIEYTAKDFLEKNRDYVPMEITDLLLQSDDHLVNLLFRSRLRKTGSVIYTEQEKQEKVSTLFRTSVHKTATANRTQGTVSTYFRYSLMELVSAMASAQPTFIRCLVPNRLSFQTSHVTYDHTSYFPHHFTFDANKFDETVVLEQIRYSGLLETIEIRRSGYSHRIPFEDFISVYSCLIHLNSKPIINNDKKQICELILKKIAFNDYAIGKTKLFLKYHHIEHLNLLHKNLTTKIIRLQSRIRMYLIIKQNQKIKVNTVKTEYELSVARLQAIVRGFLVRASNKKASSATVTIQTYWRMWYERTQFRRLLLKYRNQQVQVSYFLKQVELFGSHLYQQLTSLNEIKEYSIQSSMKDEKKPVEDQLIPKIIAKSKPKPTLKMTSKRNVIILCTYYDAIHKEYLRKRNKPLIIEVPKETITDTSLQRPSTAPSITNIPQAPPCPPAEFFKQPTTEIRAFKRQQSALLLMS
jgi:myosin heavy subunit